MKKYYAIIKNQMHIALNYKYSLISAFILPLIQIFITIFIWKEIYNNTELSIGYSLNEMITYIIISTFIAVTYGVTHAFRLSKMVKTGSLSFILIRPYSYLLESFSVYVGRKIIEIGFLTLIFIVLNTLGVISIKAIGALGILLLITNFMLVFMFVSFIGTFSYWLIQMWTIKPLFIALTGLLGGTYFPLDILPSWIYSIIKYNPFSMIGFVNTKVFLGQLYPNEVLYYLIASVIWCVTFYIGHKILWLKGLKIYEGMGA